MIPAAILVVCVLIVLGIVLTAICQRLDRAHDRADRLDDDVRDLRRTVLAQATELDTLRLKIEIGAAAKPKRHG